MKNATLAQPLELPDVWVRKVFGKNKVVRILNATLAQLVEQLICNQ
jgi:hypothetical protein